MAQYPKERVVICTIGCATPSQRFQFVIPLVDITGMPPVGVTALGLIGNWLEPTIYPLIQACWVDHLQILGVQIESLVPGGIVPLRKNYPVGTYVGTIADTMGSPSDSMLLAFHSTSQADGTHGKVREAKTYVGPPPQTTSIDGMVTGGTLTALTNLATAIVAGIAEPATAHTWKRALSTFDFAGTGVFAVDEFQVRGTTFTQRRRFLPKV